MRHFAIAFGALAFSGSAFAADVSSAFRAPARPSPGWGGCYLGGNFGLGLQYNGVFDPSYPTTSLGSDTGTGIVGGGQVGCDYQFAGNWVVGIQGMFDGTDVNGSHLVPYGYAGDNSETMSFKTTWFGTLAGRIGYAFLPAALVYVKAGSAWAHIDYTDADPSGLNYPPFVGQAGATVIGWMVVGVGAEYVFRPNWSLFAEYDYMDVGTHNIALTYNCGAGCGFANPYTFQETHSLQTVLFGLNYRFGGLW